MKTRKHVCEVDLPVPPEEVFQILVTPSAIRAWWGAARAIVDAREGGQWSAAWGKNEDKPDYISTFRFKIYDPPDRIVFTDSEYYSKDGPLPFKADFVTEFAVIPAPSGSILRVTQDGFPADPLADDFYRGCEIGWKNTFEGIKKYLLG